MDQGQSGSAGQVAGRGEDRGWQGCAGGSESEAVIVRLLGIVLGLRFLPPHPSPPETSDRPQKGEGEREPIFMLFRT
ncbi:hypothetical protein EMIT0347P_30043 [Pseudomonas sp. IT-347P]